MALDGGGVAMFDGEKFHNHKISDGLTALKTLEKNTKEHDVSYWGLGHEKNGIVHVIGPMLISNRLVFG
ncbi:hypothetical protein N9K77_00525 [bacterium]|nr:hypothetical protein [bacterium]